MVTLCLEGGHCFPTLLERFSRCWSERAPLKTGVDGAGGAAKLRERKWASLEARGPAPGSAEPVCGARGSFQFWKILVVHSELEELSLKGGVP